MSLKQELPKILEFFEMEPEEKALHFHSTVENAIQFSENLQEAYRAGSEKQREEIHDMLSEMREKISEQTKILCNNLGLSEEELVAYAENPDNFSKDEWELLKEANKKMNSAKKEFAYVKRPKTKRGKGKVVSKKEWVHS